MTFPPGGDKKILTKSKTEIIMRFKSKRKIRL